VKYFPDALFVEKGGFSGPDVHKSIAFVRGWREPRSTRSVFFNQRRAGHAAARMFSGQRF